jgi:hypothetical protein
MAKRTRIKITREQRKNNQIRVLLTDVLDSLSRHNDGRYYDYILRLERINHDFTKRKKLVGHHKHEELGQGIVRVYRIPGGIA